MRTRLFLAALLVLAALPADGEELWGRRIEALAFRGDAPIEEASFARLTDLGPGLVLTEGAVHTSLRNLFATGRFADLAVEAAPAAEGAVVTIVFSAAARVAEVEVAGERIPVKGRVLDALKTRPRDSWSEERGRTATRSALRVLEERGYFEAEVTPWVSPGPDETSVNVRFEVVAGRPAEPAPAEFTGDLGPLTADELRRKGKLRKERVFRETVAREDAERYAGLYRELGRSRAEVRYEGVSYERGSGRATARYAVFAGPDVVLDVTGIPESVVRRHPASPWAKGDPPDADALERLRAALRGELQGKGYARAEVDVDVDVSSDREEVRLHAELRSALGDGGFPDGRVEARAARRDAEPGAPVVVDVVYEVSEGPRAVFGKTILRGARATRLSVLERELAYEEGAPFSMARLIRTQQNLDRLGVFSRVDVSGLSPEPGGATRSILVQVEEAKPWSLLYGLGVEYDERAERAFNPRLSLALTHANLFGRAIAGVVEARYSRRDTRVLLRLADRSVFDSGLAGTITGYVAEEIRQSYSVRRGGAFFEASRVFAGTVKGALRYQYEIVEPDAPPDILSEIERQDQRILINSIGASTVIDRRDDPIVPSKGFFAAVEGKWAFPVAAADAHFLKGSTQFSLYRPFRGGTLAAGVRAGATKSLVTCNPEANPGCLPNLDTPIVERVFAGGRTTHRSFPLDDLGVPGQTLRDGRGIGGNAFLLANVEWRVPLTGGLGIVLFADWGNVWAGPAYVKVSEGRWGAGLGIHYLTPVGPFRLEYGFRLDRKRDEDTGALSFSIGYPF